MRLALFFALVFGFTTIGAIGMIGTLGTIGTFGLPAPALGGPASEVQMGAEGTGDQDSGETLFNPHGNVVFRATGATSCRDCHASGRSSSGAWPALENERVQALVAKGKGAHVGRFADCFRCHPGGSLPSERP